MSNGLTSVMRHNLFSVIWERGVTSKLIILHFLHKNHKLKIVLLPQQIRVLTLKYYMRTAQKGPQGNPVTKETKFGKACSERSFSKRSVFNTVPVICQPFYGEHECRESIGHHLQSFGTYVMVTSPNE